MEFVCLRGAPKICVPHLTVTAQSQRSPYHYERDRDYVCTLSAMVVKSATAHLFHVGDTRIYRLRDGTLEQLTNHHRLRLADDVHYLGRALGINAQLKIDYRAEALEAGDVFVPATAGVCEPVALAREGDPKGDRVHIVVSGKFFPYEVY